MRATRSVSLRRRFGYCLGAALCGLVWCSPTSAEPIPLPPAEQAKVKSAIGSGMSYLKRSQGREGTWADDKVPHKVGYAALPALTLLECGVPVEDVSVQMAAAFVRGQYEKITNTYEIALAILLLDRVRTHQSVSVDRVAAQNVDKKLIEILALRLLAGQTSNGGWHYSCPAVTPPQHAQMLKALRDPKMRTAKLPASLRKMPVFQDLDKLMEAGEPASKKGTPKPATPPPSDNSNTQFASLALWVAQRNGLPVERGIKLLGKRFRGSQNADGGWGYAYQQGGGVPESPAMICSGLLGLAIEQGILVPADRLDPTSPAAEAARAGALVAAPSLLTVHLANRDVARELAAQALFQKRLKDGHIAKGFQSLSKHVGQPQNRIDMVPQGNLYFLWALERVAMLYDLRTVDGKDWYRWGVEGLLANQKSLGNWENGGYPGAAAVPDTCFALLFLRQVNLAGDLTERLRPEAMPLENLAKDPAAPPPALTPANVGPMPSIAEAPTSVPPAPPPTPPVEPKTQTQRNEPAPTAPREEPPAPAQASGGKGLLLLVAGGVALVLLAGSAVLLILSRQGRPAAHPRPVKKASGRNGNGRQSAATKARKARRGPAAEE